MTKSTNSLLLDPATLDNTIDPITAFIAMSRRLDAGESCDASFEVFDGRRRYDVTLTNHGPKMIEPSDYSVFTGEAIGCHLEFEKIGGFWQGENKYSETARNRVIWVARPIENGPPVPVQLTIETGFGSVLAHLTGFASAAKNWLSKKTEQRRVIAGSGACRSITTSTSRPSGRALFSL